MNQASRETLLEIIAELRQRVESLEARLSGGGGPGARMPGHKPAARRKEAAEEEKKPRRKRPHGFARPRMEPERSASDPRPGVLPRMPYYPERGLGAADPGGHRTSGVSCRSYRACLHSPDVSAVPETAVAPGPSERSGRGPSTPGSQPRIQYGAGSGESDRDPAGRGTAAHKDNPMVSANVSSVETERWGHRPGRPSSCPAGRAGSGRGPGVHPVQPGGPRR